MNSVLLLANAIALTVLVGLQLIPENGAVEAVVAQRIPHFLQLQKAPQLAVMSDRDSPGKDVSQENTLLRAPSSERLVF